MTELDLQTSNKNPSEADDGSNNNNMDEFNIVLMEFIEELEEQKARKKRRILQLKDILLRAGFEPGKISTKITSALKDHDVSERYIRKVLGVEFKDPSQIRGTSAAKHLLEESSIPEEPREEAVATTCNHEPYIEHLKQQIKELKQEIEAKDKEIAELKGRQPTTSSSGSSSSNNPAVFSSKTHEDYYNRKYRIKKH